jgi:hypothetical protein
MKGSRRHIERCKSYLTEQSRPREDCLLSSVMSQTFSALAASFFRVATPKMDEKGSRVFYLDHRGTTVNIWRLGSFPFRVQSNQLGQLGRLSIRHRRVPPPYAALLLCTAHRSPRPWRWYLDLRTGVWGVPKLQTEKVVSGGMKMERYSQRRRRGKVSSQ